MVTFVLIMSFVQFLHEIKPIYGKRYMYIPLLLHAKECIAILSSRFFPHRRAQVRLSRGEKKTKSK